MSGTSTKYRSSYAEEPASFAVASEFLVADERGALELPNLQLPLLILVVGRPRPSSTSVDNLLLRYLPTKDPLVCAVSGSQGTAGVAVEVAGKGSGILTAGHVFPHGAGSAVERIERVWLWKRRTQFGFVARHCSPYKNASGLDARLGWDAAVVMPVGGKQRIVAGVRPYQGAEQASLEPVFARCGASGIVRNATTMLRARLEEVDAGGIIWNCVWLVFPSGVMTSGDSGASVFLQSTGELLGTYVGCSKLHGAEQVHYVQDAMSLEANVLRRWGVSFS